MPKTKRGDDRNARDPEPRLERPGVRSSPGSGEDDDEAADLQPDEVEDGDTAR